MYVAFPVVFTNIMVLLTCFPHCFPFGHFGINIHSFNLIRQWFRKLYLIMWSFFSFVLIVTLYMFYTFLFLVQKYIKLIYYIDTYLFIVFLFYKFLYEGFVFSQSNDWRSACVCLSVSENIFATWLKHVKLTGHWSKVCYDQLSLN